MSGKFFIYDILMVITILSAVGVVTVKNIFHSALLLGLVLISIAMLYLLLGAEFLAAVQILVYIGGILTLLIFAIMLTKNLTDKNIPQTNNQKLPSFLISAFIFVILVFGILKAPIPEHIEILKITNTSDIGHIFFQNYVLAFEILSVVLLVALVGAIVIASKGTDHD